jgi:hypothetical protein
MANPRMGIMGRMDFLPSPYHMRLPAATQRKGFDFPRRLWIIGGILEQEGDNHARGTDAN